MPFIEIPLGSAHEAQTVPEAVYGLRIVGVDEKEGKESKRPMLMVMIEVTDPPAEVDNPAMIFEYLMFPMEGDKENTVQMFLLDIKRFLTVFGIPFEEGGFNSDDLPGATGECLVIETTNDKDEVRNELRLPKLED